MTNEQLKQIAQEAKDKRPKLVICGGGHVGYYVAKHGQTLDFEIIVIDDREAFATQERFEEAQVICKPFREAIESFESDEMTYFVITTRGHATDYQCLKEAINKPHAYIGMLGSKRKVALLMEQLQKEGYTEEKLGEVHTPIGLPIGGQTPAEISISIMAQLIQIRSGKGHQSHLDQQLIQAILNDEVKVVATITEQYGSAPRGVGAMLAITQDRKILGTVGGGRVEKEVIDKAFDMMDHQESQAYIYHPMNHQSEEKEKMICGGAVHVTIECVEN